ncbi:MAG TPA: hypothetical protein P5572_20875 [Phycisphaerae bacterium]|nr:hypothetical protein [Phycisphaerales bacterium]HRX87487.1 hypothetical protein [Phycisphaerae bacterium]
MPRKSSISKSDAVPTTPATAPPSARGTTPGQAFRAELEQVVAPLQRAVETLLNLAAGPCSSATELARALDIETTLAWRMWRLMQARSADEASGFVVGTTALQKVLTACRRSGADETLTTAVREAHQGYRDFVRRAAGDEATLRDMLASADDEGGSADGVNRRVFNANCLRLGVQAASQLRCCIMHPGSLDGIGSAAVIDMFSDVWWLRGTGEAVFRVVRLFHTHAPEDPGAPVLHLATPLDPTQANAGADRSRPALPLISSFCTGDATVVDRNAIGGSMIYTMKPAAVGRDRTTTLCFGEIQHDCVLPLAEDPQMIFSTASMIPAEMLVLEVYVHADQVAAGFVFRPLITDVMFRALETGLWAPRVEPAAIGGTFAAIEPTPLVDSPIKSARYRELIKYAFERIGMKREHFHCYRLRLPAPQLGLMVSLMAGSDLEDPPAA